ncbi:hypothetical protein NEPAR04_0217 [Nematocida parisii]|nr:hypothetical protein NEPAR03_0211 [Nematocida parisii]KAI5125695.1 hypothetical protein NEPAR08_0133 [Nematocida parisii]KAI5140272.1 hypothetical protein NEPAR04_0217 [Nematocida parisii]
MDQCLIIKRRNVSEMSCLERIMKTISHGIINLGNTCTNCTLLSINQKREEPSKTEEKSGFIHGLFMPILIYIAIILGFLIIFNGVYKIERESIKFISSTGARQSFMLSCVRGILRLWVFFTKVLLRVSLVIFTLDIWRKAIWFTWRKSNRFILDILLLFIVLIGCHFIGYWMFNSFISDIALLKFTGNYKILNNAVLNVYLSFVWGYMCKILCKIYLNSAKKISTYDFVIAAYSVTMAFIYFVYTINNINTNVISKYASSKVMISTGTQTM